MNTFLLVTALACQQQYPGGTYGVFSSAYKEEYPKAHFRLPPEYRDKLDKFAREGNLQYMPEYAGPVLTAIARDGVPAFEFVLKNHTRMREPDGFRAFVNRSTELAYGWADFDEAIAEAKASRERWDVWKPYLIPGGIGLGAFMLGLYLGWRIRPQVRVYPPSQLRGG